MIRYGKTLLVTFIILNYPACALECVLTHVKGFVYVVGNVRGQHIILMLSQTNCTVQWPASCKAGNMNCNDHIAV